MSNIRYKPKWLTFLIPVSIVLAALGAPGCSGDNKKRSAPPPVYSQEAGIASITLNKGSLNPPYSDKVRNYSAGPFYVEASDFSLTVTLKDAKAKLTINGNQAGSGAAFPVAVGYGKTAIRIVVEAEDGKNSNIVSIIAAHLPPSTPVYAYDGPGGAPVKGVMLKLCDINDNLLVDDVPLKGNGEMPFGLDRTEKYNIYAKAPGTATSCFMGFDPFRESEIVFYCKPQAIAFAQHAPPIVADIAFPFAPGSVKPEDFRFIPPGVNHIEAAINDVRSLLVTVMAESWITNEWEFEQYRQPGPGSILVNIDGPAVGESSFDSLEADYIPIGGVATPLNEPVSYNNKQYYRSSFFWNFWREDDHVSIPFEEHWIDIVVYDMANNRTEQRLYITVTDAGSQAVGDPSLAGVTPVITDLQSVSRGATMGRYGAAPKEPGGADVNAVDPLNDNDYGVDFCAKLTFSIPGAPDIRGVEIWRSSGPDGPFAKVKTKTFGVASRLSSYTYYDFDHHLEAGPVYYKARVFNGNPLWGVSNFSATGMTEIMPAFTVHLLEPAHNSISQSLRPGFTFKVSNTELMSKDLSDEFWFSLSVRNKGNGDIVVQNAFYVDYADIDAEGNPHIRLAILNRYGTISTYDAAGWPKIYGDPTSDTFDIVTIDDDGSINIFTDNWVFDDLMLLYRIDAGAAYEWNIFGFLTRNYSIFNLGYNLTDTPFFAKYLPLGDSWSLAGTPGNPGAANGSFTLIFAPDAR